MLARMDNFLDVVGQIMWFSIPFTPLLTVPLAWKFRKEKIVQDNYRIVICSVTFHRTLYYEYGNRIKKWAGADVDLSTEFISIFANHNACQSLFRMTDILIHCPKCNWEPDGKPYWRCTCGTGWNTFATNGRCPHCGKVWEHTQCIECYAWSPHLDWYDGLDDIVQKMKEEVKERWRESLAK